MGNGWRIFIQEKNILLIHGTEVLSFTIDGANVTKAYVEKSKHHLIWWCQIYLEIVRKYHGKTGDLWLQIIITLLTQKVRMGEKDLQLFIRT